MKKLFAALLAVMMVVSMATVASAETTTLTTTVPDASYTLNVPKEVPITYGAESSAIGNFTITESAGFAEGKNLNVTFTYDAFASEEVSTKIPYTIKGWSTCGNTNGQTFASEDLPSGTTITFLGENSGSVASQTKLEIKSQAV